MMEAMAMMAMHADGYAIMRSREECTQISRLTAKRLSWAAVRLDFPETHSHIWVPFQPVGVSGRAKAKVHWPSVRGWSFKQTPFKAALLVVHAQWSRSSEKRRCSLPPSLSMASCETKFPVGIEWRVVATTMANVAAMMTDTTSTRKFTQTRLKSQRTLSADTLGPLLEFQVVAELGMDGGDWSSTSSSRFALILILMLALMSVRFAVGDISNTMAQ